MQMNLTLEQAKAVLHLIYILDLLDIAPEENTEHFRLKRILNWGSNHIMRRMASSISNSNYIDIDYEDDIIYDYYDEDEI